MVRHQAGRTESTSVAAAKIHQFEGWREWWFGFWQADLDLLQYGSSFTHNDREVTQHAEK